MLPAPTSARRSLSRWLHSLPTSACDRPPSYLSRAARHTLLNHAQPAPIPSAQPLPAPLQLTTTGSFFASSTDHVIEKSLCGWDDAAPCASMARLKLPHALDVSCILQPSLARNSPTVLPFLVPSGPPALTPLAIPVHGNPLFLQGKPYPWRPDTPADLLGRSFLVVELPN
uniref:Uncharacterized protein n=1 Tax=Mycena chlorophos TaxID=658473 RepID=A0ABQ0LMV7_MYCCL|nr:predicted protein [Mycena chlorophos]